MSRFIHDAEAEARRADEWRDSLADLNPPPASRHVPVTREQLDRAIYFNEPNLIPCGAQTNPEASK